LRKNAMADGDGPLAARRVPARRRCDTGFLADLRRPAADLAAVGPSRLASALRPPDAGPLLAVYGARHRRDRRDLADGDHGPPLGADRATAACVPRTCAECRPRRMGGTRSADALRDDTPDDPRVLHRRQLPDLPAQARSRPRAA